MSAPFFQLTSSLTETIYVLLIEDGSQETETTRTVLKELTFIGKIKCIREGKAALDFLSRKRPLPDLILLDVDDPYANGIDLLRQIRITTETRTIPVLIISTPNDNTRIFEMYEAGASSYIPKPVSPERLRKVLKVLGFRLNIKSTKPSGCL